MYQLIESEQLTIFLIVIMRSFVKKDFQFCFNFYYLLVSVSFGEFLCTVTQTIT